MIHNKRDAGSLKLLGGRLCLDFINTLDWRGTENPQEFLNTFQDLIIWSRHVGITTLKEAKNLSLMAAGSKIEAKMILNRAIKLRETIYPLFYAVIESKDPAEEDLTAFNQNLSRSMKDSKIIKSKDGYVWDPAGNKTKLDWILNPIICSAADLFVSDELKKVKVCSDPACGWLFLDVSRNQSRRWCDMQDCGNRAKASRFFMVMLPICIGVNSFSWVWSFIFSPFSALLLVNI